MDRLFDSLTTDNFPDLFTLLWVTALVMIAVSIAIYWDAGKRYRRYPVLLSMHEWIFWSVVLPWSLVLLLVITHVPFIVVLLAVLPGMAILLWARFVKYPPLIAAANDEVRRRRFVPPARVEARGRPRPTPAGRRRRHSARH